MNATGQYAQVAYEAAKLAGLTAAQVAQCGYRNVAALAKVAVAPAPDDSCAADFFFRHVRDRVATRLRREETAQRREALALTFEQWLKTTGGAPTALVSVTDDGWGVRE